jgi:hypothetical protein
VLDDLKTYPDIRDRVARHYIEIEGSNGHLLFDSRRQPIRSFGCSDSPVFADAELRTPELMPTIELLEGL